ncbi:alpha/beta fold hydrolase [Cognaticolwellia mytili]|uniref:alpha/beta fold hydrolase n=1 Tax=Cognaticolwellia mytili TaxID=1888913 RepID=UPI000A171AA3|nr:alpha/beta hydrolase [Cognaticolwellia mytili]
MSRTIYFIPGTMCDKRLWQPTWQLLGEQFLHRCQLTHLPIPTTGNMEDVVEEMARKIVAKDAVLVGFSLGGYIASAIALKIPELISHLVVVSNLPKNLPDAEVKQRKRTITWIANRGYSGIPNKRIEDLLHPNIKQFNAESFINIKDVIVNMDRDLGVNVLLHQLEVSMSRPSLLGRLSHFNLPVKFLVGDVDTLVDISILKDEVSGADNISITKVENTGHMLPLESPKTLALELTKVLLSQ